VFGFSWSGAVFAANTPAKGLGFPWISSTESRLINGLRGKTEEYFFSTLFPWAGRGIAPISMRLRRIGHAASLTDIRIFRNGMLEPRHQKTVAIPRRSARGLRAL
jgi:hypothetical protein